MYAGRWLRRPCPPSLSQLTQGEDKENIEKSLGLELVRADAYEKIGSGRTGAAFTENRE